MMNIQHQEQKMGAAKGEEDFLAATVQPGPEPDLIRNLRKKFPFLRRLGDPDPRAKHREPNSIIVDGKIAFRIRGKGPDYWTAITNGSGITIGLRRVK